MSGHYNLYHLNSNRAAIDVNSTINYKGTDSFNQLIADASISIDLQIPEV